MINISEMVVGVTCNLASDITYLFANNEIHDIAVAIGVDPHGPKDTPDLSGLRYGRICILSDADVDGSHIRTLLLTFFYRQMPELIDRGHIYIAQPPLYKIKRGKQEVYVKDDAELNTYLLAAALDGAALHVNTEAPPLSGVGLETITKEHIAVENIITRLAPRYDEVVLRTLSEVPAVNSSDRDNLDALEAWTKILSEALPKSSGDRAEDNSVGTYTAELDRGDESGEGVRIAISRLLHGISTTRYLPREFFVTSEYKHIVALAAKIGDLLSDDSTSCGATSSTPRTRLRRLSTGS